ncbi:MAG: response regulator [Reyranella sp.]|nr:response regulator [Reyranella sp.]
MLLLLIEDDDDLRGEIREYLVRRRHDVTALGSAAKARELLDIPRADGAAFDAIVCDVNLTDGNGIDLYAAFGSRTPACRWILMSGDPDAQRLDDARRKHPTLSPCIVVEKPVSLRRLAELLTNGHNDE